MENARADIIRKISEKIQQNQAAINEIDYSITDILRAVDGKYAAEYLKRNFPTGIRTIASVEPANEGMAYLFLGEIIGHLNFEKNRRQELIDMYTSTDYITTELEVLSQDIPPMDFADGTSIPYGEQNVQISG